MDMDHAIISSLPELFLGAAFLALSFVEYRWPNQRYQANRTWFTQLFWLQIAGVILTSLVGWAVTDAYQRYSLLSPAVFQQVPALWSGLIGYLLVTFINYWWHRFRHSSDLLWRLFHQIHHSTHRLQTATALYSHPLDYASTLLIINIVAYSILGFDAERAAWTTAWVGVFELWEHTNIRTPRWLGFVIVRPEMHRIHHELNRHRNNYGIPLWDMLFGTYENSHREVLCGFSRERESRLREMLHFRDVHKN